MKRLLALFVLALLTACGGSGDDPTQQVASCTARVVSVVLLGDSTQVGAYLTPANGYQTADPSPATELQANMDSEFGPGAVVVTTYAVSGSAATQAPHVVGDVIVENFGINDMRTYGETMADYVAAVKATGATLIVTQSPIVGGYQWDEAGHVAAVAAIGLPVADVHAYVSALNDWQALLSDGIHPLPSLYKLIDDNVVAPAVSKQVAPLRCVGV